MGIYVLNRIGISNGGSNRSILERGTQTALLVNATCLGNKVTVETKTTTTMCVCINNNFQYSSTSANANGYSI